MFDHQSNIPRYQSLIPWTLHVFQPSVRRLRIFYFNCIAKSGQWNCPPILSRVLDERQKHCCAFLSRYNELSGGPVIVTIENFNELYANPKEILHIYMSTCLLGKASILSPGNFSIIMRNLPYAEPLFAALNSVYKKKSLNGPDFHTIANQSEYIARGMQWIQSHQDDFQSDGGFKRAIAVFLENSKMARKIYTLMDSLSKASSDAVEEIIGQLKNDIGNEKERYASRIMAKYCGARPYFFGANSKPVSLLAPTCMLDCSIREQTS